MPVITTVAKTVPPHVLPREQLKAAVQQYLPLDRRRIAALLSILDNVDVDQRYSVFPLDYLAEPRSLTRLSQEYQEHAIALARHVASDCLAQAGTDPAEIDLLITVSGTGVMIPSVDAHLINELGFRRNTRRLPITELGCAAGAAALSRAYDYIRAYPNANVLAISVELPSLTFQHQDLSQANMISLALFGDGAAAALVTGREAQGMQILDTESYLFPDTINYMGFDLKDGGFHIVLSKDIPQLVRSHIRELLQPFLGRHELSLDDLSFYVLHPGGKKILLYLEEELGLQREQTGPSWAMLRKYGNISSASVLFVLDEWMRQPPQSGSYGLLAGFGPGFSGELLLLRRV